MKKKGVFLLVLMVLFLTACGETSSSPLPQEETPYEEDISFDNSLDTWSLAETYDDETSDSSWLLDKPDSLDSAYEDIYIEN